MARFRHARMLMLAAIAAVMLSSFAQAKRFKRYPGDLKEEKEKAAASQPAPSVSDEFPDYGEEEAEEAPGMLGYALHGRGGVTVEYIYTGDVFNNMRGGLNTRNATEYVGLLDVALTADLDHYGLAPGGTIFMLAESYHGQGISGQHVGDFQWVTNIEAGRNNFQMSEFWWERGVLDGRLTFRLGKQDGCAEFGVVDLGGDFIGASYGLVPSTPMTCWPDGGMAVTTFLELTDWLNFNAGVFDGAADGRTWGFSGTGITFSIFEFKAQWALLGGRLPGDAHVGMWYHSSTVENLADANIVYGGNHGLYLGFDQLLLNENCDAGDAQGLGTFCQFGWAPEDRNEVARYFGTGLVYKGLIPCRDDDIIGLGAATVFFSNLRGSGDRETQIELFYKIPLTPYITIQPDLQYISHPDGDNTPRDAFVAGMRFEAVL